jgi:predicted nucleic acid-binding protein
LTVAPKYLLDSNVLSELRKPRPDQGVQVFLSGPEVSRAYLSVLTIGELRKGVAAKRRTDPVVAGRVEAWVNDTETEYSGRLIAVDVRIATLWGELSAGRSLPPVDTLLATSS